MNKTFESPTKRRTDSHQTRQTDLLIRQEQSSIWKHSCTSKRRHHLIFEAKPDQTDLIIQTC